MARVRRMKQSGSVAKMLRAPSGNAQQATLHNKNAGTSDIGHVSDETGPNIESGGKKPYKSITPKGGQGHFFTEAQDMGLPNPADLQSKFRGQ